MAPTRRMTLENMMVLRDLGVIDVPWPDSEWAADPKSMQTPIELLDWRLTWPVYEPQWLSEALSDYLACLPHDDYCKQIRLTLWVQLAAAESERFFAQQLEKHQFESDWATDLGFVVRERSTPLSISQWRYVAWAATRRGASMARQRGVTLADVREGIFQEMRKRAAHVSSGTWPCALPPGGPTPGNAMGRCFTRHLAKLGFQYWNDPPDIISLGGWDAI